MISSDKIKFREVTILMKYPKKASYSKITLMIDWALIIEACLYATVDQEKID